MAKPRGVRAVVLDRTVAEGFIRGERDGFARVMELCGREVASEVRRYFRGAFDQEEAMQEAWLQIFRQRSSFDPERWAELGGWVRIVARRRCLDLLRAWGRRPSTRTDELDPDSLPAPLVDVDAPRAAAPRIAEFLAALDPEERTFFRLCFVEERSHEQIAAALGCNERRSKYLKRKLVERMQRELCGVAS